MNRITRLASILALACTSLLAQASGQPINVVAGENFYGDIAQQIGGKHVHVTSILSNPDQDPHLFEASASTAKALSAARLVVYNGIDYDPWMVPQSVRPGITRLLWPYDPQVAFSAKKYPRGRG
ncbi:metal ABC transporter solute-binding protein, Zn/Mn family [Aquitalea pelogenes]|uniref:metal ABC transporter solute-binding protein, Zn/Mn family n=1 Tax=Aquitalea pelogenes TaxID=1293573 RepID=UPI000787D07E|nr:zinc ABC transporter substrate-binding protein [Aquitalea pelogenes]